LKADHLLLARLERRHIDRCVERAMRGRNKDKESRTYQDQTPDHPFQSFSSLDMMVF
jgi:hypothetical protein